MSNWPYVVLCLFLCGFFTVQGCDFDFACFNGGTPSRYCSRCECPYGWTGRKCTARCGGVLNSSAGYLTSPGFPEPYSHNEHCAWKFNYPLFLSFRFITLDLESGYDFVRIKDSSQDFRFTGNSLPTPFEGFLDSNAEIVFFSDGSANGKGFSLEYEYVAGTLPWFVLTPNDTFVLQNETKSLSCHAQGFPEPHISWEKDGEKLPLAPKLASGEFYIENADEKRDSGLYICDAENSLGKIRHAFFVAVHVPPVIINSPEDIHLEYFEYQYYAFFRCEAYGIPKPKVCWKHNGTFLINPQYPDNDVPWLQVRMKPDALGNYSCYVNNSAGATESRPAILSTLSMQGYDADRWRSSIRYLYVSSSFWNQVNSSVWFRLHSHRNVARILKIFKDGKSWNSSSHSQVSLPGIHYDRHHNFRFGPSKPEDSGIYRFDVDVDHGYTIISIFSATKIWVFPRPKIVSPRSKYIFTDFIEPLTFVCEDENSDPPSTFTWFCEGRKINDDDRKSNGSYAIFHYHRRSYLFVKNLTFFLRFKSYYNLNFTCQATVSRFGSSKNASVIVKNHLFTSFSSWSSLHSYCSETCGTKPGFRLRHRVCLRQSLLDCDGRWSFTRIESCYPSTQNCSSQIDTNITYNTISTTSAATSTETFLVKSSETTFDCLRKESSQNLSSDKLSNSAVAGITFAATAIAMSVAVVVVWLVKRNQSPSCSSGAVEPPSDNMVGTGGGGGNTNTYARGPRPEASKAASGAGYKGVEIRAGSDSAKPKELPIYAGIDVKSQSTTNPDNGGYVNVGGEGNSMAWTKTRAYDSMNY